MLSFSDRQARQALEPQTASDRHRHGVLPSFLPEELVLRDRSVLRRCYLLLCCSQGRGNARASESGRSRSQIGVFRYACQRLFWYERKTSTRPFRTGYGIKTFPTDNTKLAEMEFYLLEDLEFHLVIFHPYRSLAAVAGRVAVSDLAEAGEVGAAEPDEERYWGTGEGKMDFDNGCVQMAW